jgi:hypothetical protein
VVKADDDFEYAKTGGEEKEAGGKPTGNILL